MTTKDELIEKMALEIRKRQFERTGAGRAFDETVPPTDNELDNARAAFAAIEAAGLAIVPAEATAEMRSAGYDPCRYDEPGEQPDIGDIYREMVEKGMVK